MSVVRRGACVLLGLVALTGCGGGTPCTGSFTVDMSLDTPGAVDPAAAVQDWIEGTSPVGAAPAGAPDTGWGEVSESPSGGVVLENGDWRVTVLRTTTDEWIVGTLECR